MRKKILWCLCACLIVATLGACGKSNKTDDKNKGQDSSVESDESGDGNGEDNSGDEAGDTSDDASSDNVSGGEVSGGDVSGDGNSDASTDNGQSGNQSSGNQSSGNQSSNGQTTTNKNNGSQSGAEQSTTTTTGSTVKTSPVVSGSKVTFYYVSSTAKNVAVSGTMNSWSTSCYMTKNGDVYSYTTTLSDGTYYYKFIVDGDWINDPLNSKKQDDGDGNINNYFTVGSSSSSSSTSSSTVNIKDQWYATESSYQCVEQISNYYYIGKKNGYYTLVNDHGEDVTYSDSSFTSYEWVSDDEIELRGGNSAYVYNVNTASYVYSYSCYDFAWSGTSKNFYDGNGTYHVLIDEYIDDSYNAMNNYSNGVMCQAVLYYDKKTSQNCWELTFTNVSTDKVIYTCYTEYDIGAWLYVFDKKATSFTAAVKEYSFDECKTYVTKVTESGGTRSSASALVNLKGGDGYGGTMYYTDGWLKSIMMDQVVMVKFDTAETVTLNVGSSETPFAGWIAGNDKCYAVQRYNSEYYEIYNGTTALVKQCKAVDFSHDSYIIYEATNGEIVCINTSGKELCRAKSMSSFINGYAMVYDGSSIYFIDESFKQVGDKNSVGTISSCVTGAIKATDGKWYYVYLRTYL